LKDVDIQIILIRMPVPFTQINRITNNNHNCNHNNNHNNNNHAYVFIRDRYQAILDFHELYPMTVRVKIWY
jgi:hypothetical protein